MPDARLLSVLATREFRLMPQTALFGIQGLLSSLITDVEGIKRFSLLTTCHGCRIYLHYTCIHFYLSFHNIQKLSRTIDSILSMAGLSRLLIRCISMESTIRNLRAGDY